VRLGVALLAVAAAAAFWLLSRDVPVPSAPGGPAEIARDGAAAPAQGKASDASTIEDASAAAPVHRDVVADEDRKFAITGVALRRGLPAAGVTVVAKRAGVEVASARTQQDGRFRFEVVPGTYQVSSLHALRTVVPGATQGSPPRSYAFDTASVQAPVFDADVDVQLDLFGASLVVDVMASDGSPVVGAAVSVNMVERRWKFVLPPNESSRWIVKDLPLLPCVVEVDRFGFRPASLRCELLTGDNVHQVQLEPEASVDVRLVTATGRPFAAVLPVVVQLASEGDEKRTVTGSTVRTGRQHVATFRGLQPGEFVASLRDHVVCRPTDGRRVGVSYERIACRAARDVTTDLGQRPRVDLVVFERPYVELGCVGAEGKPLGARIEIDRVEPDGRRTAVLEDTVGFVGYLEPGPYELRLTRKGRERRLSIVIGPNDLERTFSLPW